MGKYVTINIIGHIPAKKNMYKRSKHRAFGRGMFKDDDNIRQINGIIMQIRNQTGNLEPIDNPIIRAHFTCHDQRGDLDNKWTTIQDCMVSAGILKNDNLKHLRGPITISGEVGEGEGVTVEIECSPF